METEEEDIYEKDNQRVYAKFLRPDGKELYLPGVSEKDGVAYRIEALRVYLEQTIGDEKLLTVYQVLHDDSADSIDLQKILGKEAKYLPLVYQLIVCEDSYYSWLNLILISSHSSLIIASADKWTDWNEY